MDEELQKRNTDCVYFLASPLTCKKGLDCEYRHSEMARLNPRDCWYWSAGGCLNPTCAFRHPPMGGNTEASSESAALHNQSNVSVNKTDVPCYFYFNGYCHKGDKCFFMHTSVDGANAWKSSKTASSLPNGLAMEKKTSAGSETGSAPVGTHFISSETAAREPTEVKITQKEDLHQSASAPLNVSEKSASTHISVSAFEETAAINSEDSSLRAEGFDRSPSLVSIDQSSEHQLVEHIEGEDWLESSPGFDVLVADDSEKLGYEDDPEYNEGRGLNHQFMGYDCEDHPFEYDPEFPAYEQGMHDSYEHEHEHAYDYVREDRIRPEERMFDDCLTRKRSFSPIKLAYGDQLRVDLRDRLKRRRGVIGDSGNHFPRRTHSSRLIGRSRERSRQNPYGRSGSKVENNIVGSQTWSMHRFKDKKLGNRRFLPSDVMSKKRRFNEEANVFSGPKTLAQIKEEKKKGQENEYYFGKTELPERTVLEDFRGPKPLSEILKDKRRLRSTVHSNN